MASVEAVAASEAALEAAVDLSMTWRRCPDGSAAAAAAAGSTLAGIVALASSHLLYELSFVSSSSSGLQQTETDRQTDSGQTDRRTDRQTVRRPKVREIPTTSSSSWSVRNGGGGFLSAKDLHGFLGENSVFFVGVTNLAPALALKIRLKSCSMIENYFPTNCFFCLFL